MSVEKTDCEKITTWLQENNNLSNEDFRKKVTKIINEITISQTWEISISHLSESGVFLQEIGQIFIDNFQKSSSRDNMTFWEYVINPQNRTFISKDLGYQPVGKGVKKLRVRDFLWKTQFRRGSKFR